LQVTELKKEGPEDTYKQDEPVPERKKVKTILAVDDVGLFLMRIQSILKEAGYSVVCINNGASALNYLKTNTPDLFILDIDMPNMNGYELAKKIREAGHTEPIIFITGNAKRESVIKAIQSGANDFIHKPFIKSNLIERIRKYVKP
jgi:CheY-like chemotaxis protein